MAARLTSQWCRRVLLPKGAAFATSCGIVAAQIAVVAFERLPQPPAPSPPDIVVSLISPDTLLARPEPLKKAVLDTTSPRKPSPIAVRSEAAASAPVVQTAVPLPVSAPVASVPASGLPLPQVAPAPMPKDDDALQRYQDLVWRMIMARRPPAVHLRGGAQIAFHLMSDGSPCDIRIVRTSGDPMLDRLAMDTVRRAGPFPKPPAGLRPDTALEIWFQFR